VTTKQIIETVATMNYACLFVESNGQSIKFGPGELLWHAKLRSATAEQTQLLAEKLQRWNRRLSA
jgi:hypothetical protein